MLARLNGDFRDVTLKPLKPSLRRSEWISTPLAFDFEHVNLKFVCYYNFDPPKKININ